MCFSLCRLNKSSIYRQFSTQNKFLKISILHKVRKSLFYLNKKENKIKLKIDLSIIYIIIYLLKNN